MQEIIYLITGLVLGYLVGRNSAKILKQVQNDKNQRIINPEQVKQKQLHLEKVMELARQKIEIVNDDVENMLRVSNATAERYLQELETQGKLQQIGDRGKYVKYKLI